MTRVVVFVYGTLKRGGVNHARYCRHVLSIEPARVKGRLWSLPAGYAMLEVPGDDILALGSTDAAADVCRQIDAPVPRSGSVLPGEGWNLIEGELLTFGKAAATLVALDRLEEFSPSTGESLYRRVLVRLAEPAGRLAWAYVAPAGALPVDARACGNSWPP